MATFSVIKDLLAQYWVAIAVIVAILLLLYVTFTLACVYVLLFGGTNFHKADFIGRLNRYILQDLPNKMKVFIEKQFWNYNVVQVFSKTGTYFFKQANPSMQIIYSGLMIVNVALFFFFMWDQLPNRYVGTFQKYCAFPCIFVLIFSFLKASYSNPGKITKENVDQFKNSFPYDGVSYIPDQICKTCGMVKPARSKHSSQTNRCVSKFDHYCIWINNDVGELNYKWFHLFIIMNFIACFWCAAGYMLTFIAIVKESDLMNAIFVMPDQRRVKGNPAVVIQYLMSKYIIPVGQMLFLFGCSLMAFFFGSYHWYLTATNTTTNETMRFQDRKFAVDYFKDKSKMKDKKKLAELEIDEKELFNENERPAIESIREIVRKNPKFEYKNIYSHGIIRNFMEVLFPHSERQDLKQKSKSEEMKEKKDQ